MNKHQIFNHLIETFQYIGELNGSEITETPDASVISGYPSPVFNFVRFDTQNQQKINQLKSRNISFMCLPSQRMETDFEQFSREQGLEKMDVVTASFKDLEGLEYNPSSTVGIKIVKKEEDLLIFDQISSEIFDHKKQSAFNFLKPILKYSEIRLFLAYLNGFPVGCAMLSLVGDSAGLYWVGVLSDFRNRGIGTELVKCRMSLAKNLGKKIIVAHNMTPTVHLYKNMGFTQPGQLPLYVCDKQFFIF